MPTPLQPGANQAIAARSGAVVVSHDADGGLDVNLTAFLLTDQGRAQGDSGIVFYNQPDGPGGIARFVAPTDEGGRRRHRIDFDLDRAPPGIVKLAVALTEDKGRGFAAVRNLRAEVRSGGEVVELVPGSFGAERGIIALELYTRNDQPKVRAVWQGFASGLEGLCRLYGVEVAAEPPPAPAPPPVPVAPPPARPSVNLQKVSGKVDLAKGQKGVLIEKTPEIVATISWRSGTDYDVYALVLTRAGKQVDVATFAADGVPALLNYGNGAVVHGGDVKSGGGALKTETLRIRLNDDILAVVPVAYSAQSNGTGSFRRYQVSMTIDNQRGTTVTVPAENADKNDTVYTCVPGLILNTRDGVVIEPLELYSKPGSERRPKVVIAFDDTVKVEMDQGPKNKYK
jgi:tellurite resistance protein TerA